MNTFWKMVGRLVHYRGTLALALIGALISAGGLGAGIFTIPFVLDSMLGDDPASLKDILARFDSQSYGLVPNWLIETAPTGRFAGVVAALGVILILSIVGAIGRVMHTYFAMSAVLRCIAAIRKQAFENIVRLPLSALVETGTSDRISRIVRDTNQLRNGMTTITSKAVAKLLEAIVALTAAFAFDYRLTICAILVTPLIGYAIRLFGKRIHRASKRALRQSGILLGTIVEALRGARVVKVYTAEDHEIRRFEEINNRLLEEELTMRRSKALASPVVEALTMVAVIVVAGVAAWYIIRFGVDPKQVLLTIGCLAFAGASAKPLTNLWTDLAEAEAAADRVDQMLCEPIEHDDSRAVHELALHHQAIEFDDVTYTYPNASRPALQAIRLTVQHGETVAFVGPNGSGKTTLLSLVPRLFDPDSGAVKIDGIDLRDATLKSIRKQIGVVTQETVVFNDTVAANISYGLGEVPREAVEAAARQAFADEFIRSKSKGYDTHVREGGVTLSGGERQRIAIARAILRDPRILILDEATSMIDADSESQITAALAEFCRDRTSLVIAHRLSTVVNADRIVVLFEGRIVDVGRHRELLDRCEVYQQLCRTQLLDGDGMIETRKTDSPAPIERAGIVG